MITFGTARLLLSVSSLSLIFNALLVTIQVESQQPIVTTLERKPARRSAGIISLPKGSEWCKGRPAVWMPGHKDFIPDEPLCLRKGNWTKPGTAVLDVIDNLNMIDNPTVIDRHSCGVLDVNNDNRDDLYCLVGANKGTGLGFNELYISQKDGSLKKVEEHGLQKFNGTRTRLTTVVRGIKRREYVFISASHGDRVDGKRNLHTMFLKTGENHSNPQKRYFRTIPGPWTSRHTDVTCAMSWDIDSDGQEDLILCNTRGPAYFFTQKTNGKFRKNLLTSRNRFHKRWRNARFADFNGDGVTDIAIVYQGTDRSRFRIFLGTAKRPYFDWDTPFFAKTLSFASPDLEVLDVNDDGAPDIYVVQADERLPKTRRQNYCGGEFDRADWWGDGNTPPNSFTPPDDEAPDLLFVNLLHKKERQPRFKKVTMKHSKPGCGFYVKKFKKNSLVLAQGGFVRPGHQLILEWK